MSSRTRFRGDFRRLGANLKPRADAPTVMAGEAEKRMRLAADLGIFQSPDLLRVIFEQAARDAKQYCSCNCIAYGWISK